MLGPDQAGGGRGDPEGAPVGGSAMVAAWAAARQRRWSVAVEIGPSVPGSALAGLQQGEVAAVVSTAGDGWRW